MLTRPLVVLLLVYLAGCTDGVPDPTVEDCFSGDYFADCGGQAESRYACRSDGECKWFTGGVVADEFVASDCPANDLCCHDQWPYADDPAGFDLEAKKKIRREVFGHGTLEWDRNRDMTLAVSVDTAPISSSSITCAGGSIMDFDGTPCEPGTALSVKQYVESTLSFVVEASPLGFYAWSLWLEVDPERAVARACLYAYTDDLRRQCWSEGPVFCAVSGDISVTSLLDPWSDAVPVGVRMNSVQFSDGLTISGEF